MIAIRAMTAEDIDAVMKLEARTPEAPHWEHVAYQRLFSPGTEKVQCAAWVAMGDGEIEGFAVARLVVDVCELESIAVAERARRKGTGTVLLNRVSAWAAAKGAAKLELEVRAGNDSAIRFYERAGLVCEGLRRGYYREPDEDAVLMGKGL